MALCLLGISHGQKPELIYYQFNYSGTTVDNYALNPVGSNPALLQGKMTIDQGGFLSSKALGGDGSKAASNNIQTGWNTRINRSFTLAFWIKDIPVSTRLNYVFGDKQAGEFRCFTNGVAGIGNWLVRGGELPDLPVTGAASMVAKMVHIVYDSAAATYTSYVNGVQNTQVTVDSVPNVTGSGLIVGGYMDNYGLNGLMDEFRWYARALSPTEISNTWDKDLNILGNCPPFSNFSIDTILADAAMVNWIPGTGNTGFYLEYGPKGFTPGQGSLVTGNYATASPGYLIGGLQPKTRYDIYFGEFCGTGDSAYLPNPISFTTTRLCPTPTQFQSLTAGTTNIPVNWTNSSGAGSHYVIYGFAGFNPALGGVTAISTTNNFMLSGLSPATSYDIYLAADCGASQGGSDTIGPLHLTTQCASVTAFPYRQNFEPGLPNLPGSVPQCWLVSSAGDLSWYINRGATPSSGTGPAVDKSTDSLTGHYMYLETSYNGPASYLYTPEFDITQLNTPVVSFWYHMFGNSMGSLQLQVSSNGGQSWVTIADLQGQQHWGNKDVWKQMTVDISPFVSATTSFRFVGNRGVSFTGDLAIDDVVVENGPACLVPAAFFLSATDTSASFKLIGGGNSYGVEWGDAGFAPGFGCESTVNNGVFTLHNGLDSNCLPVFGGDKLIDLYLWNECDPSNKIMITFRTECAGFFAPYSNNFDAGSLLNVPTCFDSKLAGNSQSGGATDLSDFGKPLSAPYHLRIYNGAGQNISDTSLLISPQFYDLIAADKQIRFNAKGSVLGMNLLVGSWNPATQVFSLIDSVALSSQYQEVVISLGAGGNYNGIDDRVAFMHAQDFTFSTIYIDNFFYETEPACLPPLSSGFKATDVSYNSAKLEWGAAGQGQKTIIEWAMPGFIPGAGQALGRSSVSGQSVSFQIQGLASGTTYEAYLRDSCDFDKESPWIGPVQFTTNCAPVVAPHLENFDGSAWQSGINSSEGDSISACWRREPSADGLYKWGVFNSYTPSINTGPSKDHSGSGNFVYTEASSGNTGDTAWLYTPWVNVSTLSRPSLEFYFHRYGNDLPQVIVEVRDQSSGWDSLLSLSSETHQSETDNYQTFSARLDAWGDTVQVRFSAISAGCCAGDMAIDEVRFDESPTCASVTGLQAYGTSDSSAIASWDSTADAQEYQIWIGQPGSFVNGIPIAGQFLISNQASLLFDTLSASSCYELSVRAICAAGDTSTWASSKTFCSLCAPVPAPVIQSFDLMTVGTAGDLGDCWTTSNTNLLSYGWQVHQGATTSGNTGPLGDAGAGNGKYLYTEASTGDAGDEAILTSARLDLSALSSPELRFSYHMYGADIDTLHIDVLDDKGWHLNALTINGAQHFFNTDPWKDTLVDLSTYTGPVQLYFRTYRGNGFRGDLALDNIVIADPITCPAPTGLDTTSVTASSATLLWQGGSAGSYQVAYGKAVASIAGANLSVVNTNSLTIISLDGGSQYGFFVRKICAIGDTSLWSGPFYFYTDCVPMVAAPFYANFEGLGASISTPFVNCWDSYSPQALRWESEVATGTDDNTVSTGPYYDNTLYPAPMGTYMMLESSLNGSYAELISPAINVSGLQSPELVYHFHMYGQDINKLEVYLESFANGSRFLVDSVVGQKQLVGSMPFWEKRVDLSSIPLTSYKLVFRAYKGASYKGDIAIDDVWLDEAGANACIQPQSLAANAVGCDTMALSWLSTSGQSVVEYGPSGFVAGTGTLLFAVNNSTVIRGLTPGTDYDLRVANLCGTDTSDFARINRVATLNAPQPVAVINYSDSIFASKNHSAKYFSFTAAQSVNATSYYWDFDNGQTSQKEEEMTFFVYNKTYDVMLVAINGCGSDTVWLKVNVDINVDETPLGRSVELYPNPATGFVNLEFNTSKDGKAIIRLSDVTGKEVFTKKEESINGRYVRQFNVSKLPAGIYLLEVDDGEYTTSRKLIKTF